MHTRHYSSDFSSNFSSNVFRNIRARQIRGPVCIRRTVPTDIYTGVKLHRKLMGHLSSVYCVCFDQSGQYIFTGADDHLIKVWSARDGRLLSTLRGHDGEITDMSVDYENKFLASGGMDRVIRIWDIKTSRCLDCLSAHSAMVTSVKFSPYNRHGSHRYLISTSNDGCVIFWYYSIDNYQFRKLKKFQERNRPGGRILASSFSPGGSFLACVASDNFIHLYGFHPTIGPYWLKELEQHKSEVDSVQFANRGFRFVTGSTDGTAIIWFYRRGHWDSIKLDMSITLTHTDEELKLMPAKKPKVLIVQWSRDDRYVLTSTADHKIKVWESTTGKLVHELKGHKHEIYILESHPIDPRIFISASHDGTMIIWDLDRAQPIKKFQNRVEDQLESGPSTGAASIYDSKFSPDGAMIASTDSHGYLSLYGFGSSEPYRELPDQMFFHTDYRALIRDMRNFVLDDQTHIAPHLMPRPTLVDMNGNPYGQREQRFVPSYDGERVVVAPLSKAQIDTIASHITAHSHLEDEEYLHESEIPDDATVLYSTDDDATVIDSDDDATVLYSDDDDATVIYSDESDEPASITTTNTNNNNRNNQNNHNNQNDHNNHNNNTIRQPSYDYNIRPIRSTRNQRPASLAIYDYISRTPGIRTSARLRDRDRKRLCRSSTRVSAAPS